MDGLAGLLGVAPPHPAQKTTKKMCTRSHILDPFMRAIIDPPRPILRLIDFTDFVTNWKVLEDKFEIGCKLKIHIMH